MESIHDHVVYGYVIAPTPGAGSTYMLTIFTEYPLFGDITYADVMFSEVVAHYFVGSLYHSILFDIDRQPIDMTIQQYEALFNDTQQYGWPPLTATTHDDVMRMRLAEYTSFGINTSYGLVAGWVWARRVEIRSRPTKKVFRDE